MAYGIAKTDTWDGTKRLYRGGQVVKIVDTYSGLDGGEVLSTDAVLGNFVVAEDEADAVAEWVSLISQGKASGNLYRLHADSPQF